MDVPMVDARDVELQDYASESEIPLPLSEKEKRILELYDRLLKLEVELTLTKARQNVTLGMHPLVFSTALPVIDI